MIDYGEFIAATLHLNKVDKEDHLVAAFSYFDKDGNGYITQDELQQVCKEFGMKDVHFEEMIREADQNNVSIHITMLCVSIFQQLNEKYIESSIHKVSAHWQEFDFVTSRNESNFSGQVVK